MIYQFNFFFRNLFLRLKDARPLLYTSVDLKTALHNYYTHINNVLLHSHIILDYLKSKGIQRSMYKLKEIFSINCYCWTKYDVLKRAGFLEKNLTWMTLTHKYVSTEVSYRKLKSSLIVGLGVRMKNHLLLIDPTFE